VATKLNSPEIKSGKKTGKQWKVRGGTEADVNLLAEEGGYLIVNDA